MSKMVIVEDRSAFEKVKMEIENQPVCAVPILVEVSKPPAINPPSVLFLFLPSSDKIVILPFSHNDALSIPREWIYELNPKAWVVPDKKSFYHSFPSLQQKCFDYTLLEHLKGNKFEVGKFYHPTMINMYQSLSSQKNVNKSIPILQLAEYATSLTEYMQKGMVEFNKSADQSDFLYIENENITEPLQWIESSGLHVKKSDLIDKFGDRVLKNVSNDIIYTSYNPYTSTGRASATGGGINFTALSKSDGSRKLFDSRYTGGKMILMDFDSFHLRIIAKLMKYTLPTKSIHEYLAKQYLNKDVISNDEYNACKQKTFQHLYSDIRMSNPVAFFQKIYQFQDYLWYTINQTGYITSTRGRKIFLSRIENATPAKVFNYLIQLEETEIALNSITNLKRQWKNFKSKIVLYTYDSILIDYHPEDGESFVDMVIRTLSNNNEWPVKIYEGTTYHDMNQVEK